jgi:hypothetical protein
MGKGGPQPVDPKLLEASKKQTTTIAMGMKLTLNSTKCWVDQVHKEQQIRIDWNDQNRPGWRAEEQAIVQRVAERDMAAREAAAQRPDRPLLYNGVSRDGMGRVAYLASRNKLNPQDKMEHPLLQSQTLGWTAVQLPESSNTNPCNKQKKPNCKQFTVPFDYVETA